MYVFVNIFLLISWTFLEAVEFARLSFFLRSNLHQSSAEQLKTHLGIDFCPEPCGLNSKRGCQRVGERRDGEWEWKTEGRKETSPNKRPTKTRCSADPHPQKTRGEDKQETGENNNGKVAFISPFSPAFFSLIFNKAMNAHSEFVRWATICRHALMCSL